VAYFFGATLYFTVFFALFLPEWRTCYNSSATYIFSVHR